MPHPILKKSRGPSTGGPRPTARFISPHDSEDEGPSPISPNSHVVVQPPSPDPESQTHKADKKSSASGNGNGKRQGFVASKKKRPAIVRRKSSQSSNENAKGADGQGTVRDSSSERYVLLSFNNLRIIEVFSNAIPHIGPHHLLRNQLKSKRKGLRSPMRVRITVNA